MKTLLRLLLRLCFRLRAYNTNALNAPGPVLLVPNHASWLDWLFLGVVLDDDWRFVTSATVADSHWIFRKMMVNRRTFPIDNASPYAVRDMADYLSKGGRLVLFAEGRITTTGSLMKIFDGTGFLQRQAHAKVITCYLRGATRVRFVRHSGWKKWFPHVTAHFSDAQTAPDFPNVANAVARQRTTAWLRERMTLQQFEVEMEYGAQNLLAAVVETAANQPGKIAIEDASFKELTYRRLLVGADVLAEVWRNRFGRDAGERIGVLLPNVNTTPVTLLSLWAARKIPAMLNFSTGIPVMLQCAKLAGLKHIVTSQQFLDKAKLDVAALKDAGIKITYLEKIAPKISKLTKLSKLVKHTCALGADLRDVPLHANDTAVVIFTSGSEGVPKGVELTHRNLLANVRQAIAIIDVTDEDRFFNALPLFHSFGLMGGTLFPLIRGCYTFLYPSPLHYRVIPTLVADRNCTVLMGTNTFLNGYARKAHPYDFATLRFLVAGAEKLQPATFDLYAKKFGLRILEGYGATECSPIISVNTRMEPSVGTAGRFVPGLDWRLEPVEGVEEGGRLFVKGPNVMKGYLNEDAQEKFAALKGWYDTGDVVFVDGDGYVQIRGRMKRFAKISGEMVSLSAVEDAMVNAFPKFGARATVAILTQPDEDKGEKLIAVTNESRLTLADIRAAVKAKGLSNLSAPRELKVVDKIPKLGTGKTDYRELAKMFES
ncbi:AMP-binding protein [Oleiharenicola lentus]|uniref:AMP-binding protein n=1 Tax=Oleiharenicola lentus TaxID=2508720 RepID=UPI003F663187